MHSSVRHSHALTLTLTLSLTLHPHSHPHPHPHSPCTLTPTLTLPYNNPTGKALPTASIVRQRESRRSREYLRAYSQGACVSNVDSVRDKIKSERTAFMGTVTDTTITYRQHRTPSVRGARISPVVDNSTYTSKRRYLCTNCGLPGHNSRNCTHI